MKVGALLGVSINGEERGKARSHWRRYGRDFGELGKGGGPHTGFVALAVSRERFVVGEGGGYWEVGREMLRRLRMTG